MKTIFKRETAKEQGIDVKRKFVVTSDVYGFKKGDVVKLVEDDNSGCPWFDITDNTKRDDAVHTGRTPIYWDELEYLEEPKSSKTKAIKVVRKDGRMVIDLTPSWEATVSIYLRLLDSNPNEETKALAHSEILRAAKLADLYVKSTKK